MRRRWTGMGLALGLCACSAPLPAEQQPSPSSQAAPVPVERSAAVVVASASATPSAEVGPVAKVPIRATTPGRLQCETVDCDLATEVCCVAMRRDGGPIGHCAERPAPGDDRSPCCPHETPGYCGNDELTLDRRCDEASDCSFGQRCCAQSPLEGDLARDACQATCFAETCLASSTCPNGNLCAAEPGEPGGQCPLQIKPPTCGAASCKAGQTCCFDPEANKARCADSCEPGVESTFGCTAPDQCGTYECHAYAGAGQSGYVCGGDGFFGSILCRTKKDCPEQLNALGLGAGLPRIQACSHAKELPPGVKECVYQ